MSNDTNTTQKAARERAALSRRSFLRAMGAAAGAVAVSGLTGVGVARASEDFPHYPDRYGMLTDTTMCLGCRMCEMACAEANGKPAPAMAPDAFEEIRRPSAQALTVINRYTNPDNGQPVYRKVQCMHCDEPACVSACLVKAMKKTAKGPTIYDENLCIGCRYCMVACPFSIPAYEFNDPLTPKVVKCIMCYERASKDGNPPACASICPTKATVFGKRSELLHIARERILQNPDKYVDHIYGEHEVGGTSWLYLSSTPFENLGFPADVGRTPYPELTRDLLLAVPVAYVMMPPMLAGIQAIVKRRDQVAKESSPKEHKEEGR